MALVDHWPLFGLRIRTPRLELRVPSDDDLDRLVQVAKAGVHDPATMPFTTPWTDTPSPAFEREALQYWWNCRASFSAESWDLSLMVLVDEQPVGVQGLSARNFPEIKRAETGSWLGAAFQGQGFGTEMRHAVLHLAFEHLGASAITSSAFVDNPASQAVSAAAGYEPNGTDVVIRRGEVTELIRFLVTADRWRAAKPDLSIEVDGMQACLPCFGLR